MLVLSKPAFPDSAHAQMCGTSVYMWVYPDFFFTHLACTKTAIMEGSKLCFLAHAQEIFSTCADGLWQNLRARQSLLADLRMHHNGCTELLKRGLFS